VTGLIVVDFNLAEDLMRLISISETCFYGLGVKIGSIALQKFFLRTGEGRQEYSFAKDSFFLNFNFFLDVHKKCIGMSYP